MIAGYLGWTEKVPIWSATKGLRQAFEALITSLEVAWRKNCVSHALVSL